MKKQIALCLLLLPSLAYAGVQAIESTPLAVSVAEPAADEAINKNCPIAEEPIDGETFVTYDGHKVGLCCAGCDKKFLAWSKDKKDAFVQTALAGQEGSASEVGQQQSSERASEPYTLTTCPVSGQALGSMGDPIVLSVDGREVRLCCKGCVSKMETESAKYFAVVDKGLIAQQEPYYPTTTCVVSGEPLVEDGKDIGINVVVKNRLFRLCCKGCVRKLGRDLEAHFATLDAAVKLAQGKDYPLETCLVLDNSKLGAMGDPLEFVVGNRLVRLCCGSCKPAFDKNPVAFIAKLDQAWAPIHAQRMKAKSAKGDAGGHGDHGGH